MEQRLAMTGCFTVSLLRLLLFVLQNSPRRGAGHAGLEKLSDMPGIFSCGNRMRYFLHARDAS